MILMYFVIDLYNEVHENCKFSGRQKSKGFLTVQLDKNYKILSNFSNLTTETISTQLFIEKSILRSYLIEWLYVH